MVLESSNLMYRLIIFDKICTKANAKAARIPDTLVKKLCIPIRIYIRDTLIIA